jgi:glutamate racemase
MKLFLLVLVSVGGVALAVDPLQAVIEQQKAHPQGDAAVSFDQRPYQQATNALPIGVFDSGIGGLTVLEALLKMDAFDNSKLQPGSDGRADFVAERFAYLGDQANMPYGNYAAAGKKDLLRELILRDASFLLSTKPDKPPVKAIVIACNTATAFGLEDIRAALKAWDVAVPVVGVVEAGARGVMELLPRDGAADAIAVFATVGTCSCEAYPQAIRRATGLAGKPVPLILQQGCIGLAGAIEGDPAFVTQESPRSVAYAGPKPEGDMSRYGFDPKGMRGEELNSVENHVRYEVTTLVERHRASGVATPIGYVVLGCTHYPLVQQSFQAAFDHLRSQPSYRDLIRERITFINPADFTAKELFRALAQARLRSAGEPALATDAFFLSVPHPATGVKLTATGALETSYKHSRPVGDFTRDDVRIVPMKPQLIPEATRGAIQRLMPEVWGRLTREQVASSALTESR